MEERDLSDVRGLLAEAQRLGELRFAENFVRTLVKVAAGHPETLPALLALTDELFASLRGPDGGG